MNILITGGAGYIGSHVVKQLSANKNTNITIIDDLSGSNFNSIPVLKKYFQPKRFKFIKLDLCKIQHLEDIFFRSKFDVVIHLAAKIQVSESVTNPLKYFINNTTNTTHLINLCIKYNVNKFIFSSTAAVYGIPSQVPIKENSLTNPINPYGLSKLMSENVLIQVAQSHSNFKYVILRFFNVAGAESSGMLGESHKPETHLIPLAIKSTLDKTLVFKIYGNTYNTDDGTCIRDYIHVEDLANAHLKAIDYLFDKNNSEIFNCGYGHGYSVKEVVETIQIVSQNKFKVKIIEKREGDPSVLVSNNSKIREILNLDFRYDNLKEICLSSFEWEKKKLFR